MVKFSSNDIFWILLFLYYPFGVETTNTFIRSRGSLENHTRFKTVMVKIYTRFQTKMAQKLNPLGRHTRFSPAKATSLMLTKRNAAFGSKIAAQHAHNILQPARMRKIITFQIFQMSFLDPSPLVTEMKEYGPGFP